jgi:hypothetical protein
MARTNGIRQTEFDIGCPGRDNAGKAVFASYNLKKIRVSIENGRYKVHNCEHQRGPHGEKCGASQKGREDYGICRWQGRQA